MQSEVYSHLRSDRTGQCVRFGRQCELEHGLREQVDGRMDLSIALNLRSGWVVEPGEGFVVAVLPVCSMWLPIGNNSFAVVFSTLQSDSRQQNRPAQFDAREASLAMA